MEILKYNNNITVSICLITYNQENIISEVLDYILKQKTNFKYELVIGEDCSQDATRDICKEYKKSFPDTIQLLLNEQNMGLIDNFCSTVSHCSGKYIAICAGDDFWIDPLKLQKQVDFLENNPEYSMCSCEAYYTSVKFKNNFRAFLGILYNNLMIDGLLSFFQLLTEFFIDRDSFWKKRRRHPSLKRPETGTLESVLRDLSQSRYYPASANIFKREVMEQIPREAFDYRPEHIITILWAALNGKLKLLKDVMVTKNASATSVTITKSIQKKYKPIDNTENYIKLLETAIRQQFDKKKKKIIEDKIKNLKNS